MRRLKPKAAAASRTGRGPGTSFITVRLQLLTLSGSVTTSVIGVEQLPKTIAIFSIEGKPIVTPYPRNSVTRASTGSRNAASRDASLLPCNRKKAMGSRTSTTQ